MPLRARLLLITAMSLPASSVAQAQAQAQNTTLPIVFHVAQPSAADATPVADAAFIESQLARANEIFAPYAVAFDTVERVELRGHVRMEARGDRDALAAHLRPEVINCFVVASLRDVDDPSRMRSGVHWHARKRRGAHYVILSATAHVDVLAHELGHFLGNRRHSDTPGNLMSYQRAEVLPFLDAAQQARMRRRISAYLDSGELERRARTASCYQRCSPSSSGSDSSSSGATETTGGSD